MEQHINIEIGTTVWMEPRGNIAKYGRDIRSGTIVKIGRKYFYVKRHPQDSEPAWEKFELDTLKNVNADDNSEYILYPSKEAYEDFAAVRQMRTDVRQYFMTIMPQRRVSDDGIRAIYKVLHAEGCV